MEYYDQERLDYMERLREEALSCMDEISIRKHCDSGRWEAGAYVAREAHDYMSEYMAAYGESPEAALTTLVDKIIESFR